MHAKTAGNWSKPVLIRSRGISEKVVYAYNPLPAGTDDAFLRAAGYEDLALNATEPAFMFTWRYGTGLQLESVDLAPGDFLPLRESEAREFLNSTNTAELGLCVVEKADASDPKTRKAAVDALRKAERFYSDAGRKQLIALKKRHNYNDSDMVDLRYTYRAYYRNIAREQAIKVLIDQYKTPAPAKGRAA